MLRPLASTHSVQMRMVAAVVITMVSVIGVVLHAEAVV